MKGRSTRYSSSLRWKNAHTCRERSRTEPASRTCFDWLILCLLFPVHPCRRPPLTPAPLPHGGSGVGVRGPQALATRIGSSPHSSDVTRSTRERKQDGKN